ncbi:helix-turn-helix transcriptional regulator [Phytopseudomonas flavescens]|nr:helix-turn-helix transcriptional regulator [Pseudomonas flavescens]
MSIGENIREKREAAGYSQAALAEYLGVTENTIAAWEKDKNKEGPAGTKVVLMAQLFGCSTDEILMERHQRGIAAELRAIFRRFEDLPAEMKPMARGMFSHLMAGLEEEAARKTAA